jgi:hypothetical protein
MIRKLRIAGLSLILIAAVYVGAAAQGRMGGNGMGFAQNCAIRTQAAPDTLTGVVKEIQAAAGRGTPFLKLVSGDGTEITVVLGPYRNLVDQNVAIQPGSNVAVEGVTSSRFPNTFVAWKITNADTGAVFTIRDSAGRPAWSGRGNRGAGRGMGFGQGAACRIDVAGKGTFSGTVNAVNMGFAQGFPNFTLSTADGNVTIVTSPFRAVVDSGFKIAAGQNLSVAAFPSAQHETAWVAAELTDSATGATLTLRDAQGVPVNSGNRMRRNGAGDCVMNR